MITIEIVCAAIVALYVAARIARAPLARAVVWRLGSLSVASWLGEDSVIRAYGFYHYSPKWHLFLDRVPLLIVLIWPVVIDSAWTLAHRLTGANRRRVPFVAAGFVLLDAWLIEPIAVHAGLWSWTEPGLFAVPPVGVVGWALFAFAAITCAERLRSGALTVLIAPLATHALLIASWWLAFRWLNRSIAAWPGAIAAWLVLLPLAFYFFARNLRARVPRRELLIRVPGALFFFVLLGLTGRDSPALLAYAAAFAPPYLALLQ